MSETTHKKKEVQRGIYQKSKFIPLSIIRPTSVVTVNQSIQFINLQVSENLFFSPSYIFLFEGYSEIKQFEVFFLQLSD